MSSTLGMFAAKHIASPSGFVQCSVHNVRRKADCCEMKPVMNADMEVIDYVCVCKPAFACKSASERNNNFNINAAKGVADEQRSGSGAPVVIDASSTHMTAGQQHRGHTGTSISAGAGGGNGGGGDGDSADVATLFAVSFYGGSSTAPATTAPTTTAADTGSEKRRDGEGDHDSDVDAHSDVDSDASADSMQLTFPAPPHAADTTAAGAVSGAGGPQPAAHRARPRYYDPAQNAGGGGGNGGGHSHLQPRKVCWNCGMPGHEKPACPNTLCRTCHQKRGPYGTPHRCAPVFEPSPFIVPPTPSAWRAETSRPCVPGEPEGMSAVRCVACGKNGHFDCSLVVSNAGATSSSSSLPADAVPLTTPFTCCFCGVRGHTVFECRQRDRVHPDHFERRHQLVAESKATGGGGGGGGGGSYSGDSNWGQQPQQQQQPTRSYGGPFGSTSSGNTRYDSYNNSSSSGGGGGGGHRRDRTWRDDDGGHRGGYHHHNGDSNNDGDRPRRRYEGPPLQRREDTPYSTTSSRHYTPTGNNNGGNRFRSPPPPSSSYQQRDRSSLYSGQSRDRREGGDEPEGRRYNDRYAARGNNSNTSGAGDHHYGRHDSRSGGHRPYGGLHEDRQDSRRREERSGGHGRRRAKNRDYDSSDDLF
ncbi:hypothetical protein ABB37_07350 [Leptomonas pyrrhocoris]|uniref:CCHC-type domain-containing protein n=1 Tax=Leptomonas pyrrhocoris TaxID=157538 RepID=A0A0N0DT49_LEPPY|nr:hypothetical protein ABB37_07350 [Leptomonas pyrrhocoris]XP_015655430.1 hypothetical protein ABB37_07350 [Leptomonas pyrrhocoris]XP_015655431.1 hypothetical protein ABB37_07350 [Leptomonas pyrrhocoris]KPA76990.1 hypothetical protein ABB37_07350 [Leptomonas pyrrhocoris]KPA76991.1 hypothetical protein ABB37_07350 [Leptomonas pyrrhocoris]KPA76992.1 hypothetical protein ABB37_07350 [Leptomonas pyrrhocoris]|eukprot:XP_015655429.1 hypothetical protein ABB37_07350 [Leptomonas pyrrhocoris]